MANEKNPPEPVSNLQSFFSFLHEMLEAFFNFLADIWQRSGNLSRTNYEFGRNLMARGELMDAAFRFHLATRFNPRYLQAWYHLGQCELARGKRAEAVKAFRRAHALNDSHEETRYMLTLLDPASMMNEPSPTAMPAALVAEQFDAVARSYNATQHKLGYRGHVQLSAAVLAAVPEGAANLQILDLGCGSGLSGPLLRPRAAKLIGVDVSQGMLREAHNLYTKDGRPIYDMLMYMDLKEYLATLPKTPFDIVIAANVLGYVGELSTVFAGVNKALAPGGVFGFSTYLTPQTGFHVLPRLGRFAYSPDYLRAQADLQGWQEVAREDVMFYPQEKALQCVYRKVHGG